MEISVYRLILPVKSTYSNFPSLLKQISLKTTVISLSTLTNIQSYFLKPVDFNRTYYPSQNQSLSVQQNGTDDFAFSETANNEILAIAR